MSENRTIISYRKIGDEVLPENMTRKEYINYLCHQFGFRLAKGWDGIERRHHRANWSKEESFNIANRDEALKFLGITKTPNSPDGIENRKAVDRRRGSRDIRKNKKDRRTLKQRRQEEKINNLVYYFVVAILFTICVAWVFADIYYIIGGRNV